MSVRAEVRQQLRAAGLRATAPRVAVLMALRESRRPLSHAEVVAVIGNEQWDRATIFRNLAKLEQAGFAQVVSRVGGVARYSAIDSEHPSGVHHPHFACVDCGAVTCLPGATVALPERGGWQEAISDADLQLVGRCPDCRISSS